jgi:Ankyrin repeat
MDGLPPNPSHVLHEAILTNSLQIVQSYLQAGVDPNQSPPLCPLSRLKRALLRQDAVAHDIVAVHTQDVYQVSPLHIAIFNCFYRHGTQEDTSPSDTAVSIVQALVEAGADLSLVAVNIAIVVKRDSALIRIQDRTPIGLALLLKQNARGERHAEIIESLDHAISYLLLKMDDESPESPLCPIIDTTRVPRSFAESFESLLFSPEFSDVHFVCADGTVLYAHQNILAAASS